MVPSAQSLVTPPASKTRFPADFCGLALRAFLAAPEAQARVREVVRRRLRVGAPPRLVDDLVQEANLAALTSAATPRASTTALGWVAIVAARAVADHFRRHALNAQWLARDLEDEGAPASPDDAAEDPWLVGDWLAPRVARSPREQETYELLLYKARTGQTLEQVAGDHGMTTGALSARVRELRSKYEPQWQRRQRFGILLVMVGVAALAAAVWLFLRPAAGP